MDLPLFVITDAMREYSRIRYVSYFIVPAYSILLLFLGLHSGLFAGLAAAAKNVSSRGIAQFTAFFLGFYVLMMAAKFPVTYLLSFVVQHHYRLSAQSFAGWFEDYVKAQLVSFGLSWLLVGVSMWVVDRFKRRWWLILWSTAVPIFVLALFLMPLVFDPLFNKYTVMPDSPLKQRIVGIAARAGIPDAPVYLVDKSKQTRSYNAYVTGLGSSARIVLWDNILTLPEDQLLAIVGHEAGHYARHHIMIGNACAIAGMFVLFLVCGRFLPWVVPKLPPRWGVQSITSFTMVPVVYLGTTMVLFITDPIVNAVSRLMEQQADAYSVQMTGDGKALARTFVALSTKNLADPDPPLFIELWSFSHPSLRRRLNEALRHL
ncbi:MAG: M48 family metallopeptidase [Candidatus Obscuribacterales bacterium]